MRQTSCQVCGCPMQVCARFQRAPAKTSATTARNDKQSQFNVVITKAVEKVIVPMAVRMNLRGFMNLRFHFSHGLNGLMVAWDSIPVSEVMSLASHG